METRLKWNCFSG